MAEIEYYTTIISELELKICFSDREMLAIINLFTTESAIVSLDIVSSSMHPKYFILECCLICISPYVIFSFLTFLF